ncbi:brain tumor protein [Caerostris extrusa]|uniref:Brain tumor protein n=1 Tax=Caerostris extrusa TaxID=172846 RepID=A0AAV4X2X5_CAEEX|nr:brain tumor protein [Caerostris extrusa]
MALAACEEDATDGCNLCKSKFEQPRVLNCLHVFCEDCLQKHLSENGYVPNALECPDCGQGNRAWWKRNFCTFFGLCSLQ